MGTAHPACARLLPPRLVEAKTKLNNLIVYSVRGVAQRLELDRRVYRDMPWTWRKRSGHMASDGNRKFRGVFRRDAPSRSNGSAEIPMKEFAIADLRLPMSDELQFVGESLVGLVSIRPTN